MAKTGIFVRVLPLAVGAVLAAGGCGSGGDNGSTVPGATSANSTASGGVDAKGSTFIQPLLTKAFGEYKTKTGFYINYQGGGSSAGIQNVSSGVIPFGASDAPMSDEEEGKSKVHILNLPLTAGSIAIIYNVPGMPSGLKLDGDTLANIFMAKIAKWNDPKIAALNPGAKLPDTAITLQVRTDGSGSTYVLSDYLSKVSPDWKASMGTNKKMKWGDRAQQAKGSDGVTNAAKQTPGSITYAELSYAKSSGLGVAAIKNSVGKFVGPDPTGVTAAAGQTVLPADFRVSIVNAPGAESYPLSTYSFGLVPDDLTSNASGKQIVDALLYMVTDGQQFAEPLGYAKLPDKVAAAVQAALKTVKTK